MLQAGFFAKHLSLKMLQVTFFKKCRNWVYNYSAYAGIAVNRLAPDQTPTKDATRHTHHVLALLFQGFPELHAECALYRRGAEFL